MSEIPMNGVVQTGLDVFLAHGLPDLRGKRFGLVTNNSGVDSQLRSNIDLLRNNKHAQLAALFGPEHGVRGDAQAGVKVSEATDARSGLPVHSLYGDTRRPTPEILASLDALMYDIQDVGVRYATYISTLYYAQEGAAAAGLQFIVLDRPNPLTGRHIEGNLLDAAFTSFVGIYPLPIRHGLTVGELALLFAAEQGWPAPQVVKLAGWRREMWYDQTNLPWVLPSPNLPTLDSVTLYSGTCLVEGTSLSEGRGTTRPFELIGAPWLDPFALADALAERGIAGAGFRPAYFTPTFQKHAGVSCGGVQIHITDRTVLDAAQLGVELLYTLRRLNPSEFAWRQGNNGRYFIDLLCGSDRPRTLLHAGALPAEVTASWAAEDEAFAERRRPYLLY